MNIFVLIGLTSILSLQSGLVSCRKPSSQLLSICKKHSIITITCLFADSGDVCFDKTSGFWLVHSVPNFPPRPSDGYSYPDSATIYGQTFLCITYPYSEFNVIGMYCLHIHCVSKKHHPYYLCDIFVRFYPILLIFGRNIPQEIRNKHMYMPNSYLVLYVCTVLCKN